MRKAATERLCPSSPDVQAELRRSAGRAQRMAALRALPGQGPLLNSADEMDACPARPSPRGPRARPHCAAPLAAASRTIAASLSRDSPPAAPLPQRPHASSISVPVSNAPAAAKAGLCDTAGERPTVPVKRRRVTAEMEGKYIINVPGAPRRGRRKSRNSKRPKVCRGHLSLTGWEPRRKRTRPQEGSPRGSSADWAMPWGPMGTKPPRATTTAPCSSTLASKKNSPNLPLRKALSREGPSRRKPPVRKPNRSPSPQPPSDRVAGTPPVAVRQQNRHRRRLKSAASALWQCRSKRRVVTAPARRIKANPNFGVDRFPEAAYDKRTSCRLALEHYSNRENPTRNDCSPTHTVPADALGVAPSGGARARTRGSVPPLWCRVVVPPSWVQAWGAICGGRSG
ncbi:uncharacterized protein LOC141974136 isoform X2 [Athene noctua]|uniref:uncharacterized protein LOC141974136 isoform X2 n=1 Tax=Athene noctua TaxID=126797 RepID=UPI003EBD7B43